MSKGKKEEKFTLRIQSSYVQNFSIPVYQLIAAHLAVTCKYQHSSVYFFLFHVSNNNILP